MVLDTVETVQVSFPAAENMERRLVALQFEGLASDEGWTIQRAEDLLASLKGVVSVRVVARPGGKIDEIHVLTTEEVSPKQTVRNIESALKAHFQLEVDHRIISVAQSSEPVIRTETVRQPEVSAEVPGGAGAGPSLLDEVGTSTALRERPSRILFLGHQVETERARRVRVAVSLEWEGEEFTGEAIGTDLPRSRLEAVANATLKAIEAAVVPEEEGEGGKKPGMTLALDGVKTVEAFDRKYILVGINAIHQRDVAELAGSSALDDTPERAVILAVLQATDRWVRGRC